MMLAIAPFLSILGQFLLVSGIAFVVMVLLASYLRFENLARPAGLDSSAGPGPAGSLEVELARRLSVSRAEPFLVAVWSPVVGSSPVAEHQTRLISFLGARVRKTDRVARYGEEAVGLILEAGRGQADGVMGRLAAATKASARETGDENPGTRTYRIGVSSFPENGDRAAELLRAAAEARDPLPADGALVWGLAPSPSRSSAGPASEPEADASQGASPPGAIDERSRVLPADRLVSNLQKFMARCRKLNQPVSLLCLDFDPVGGSRPGEAEDAEASLYREAAGVVSGRLREGDLLARHPDSGFVAGLACPCPEALRAGRRVAECIRNAGPSVYPVRAKITLSGGVAGFPDHGSAPGELLKSATLALRAARARGRQVWLEYDDSMRAGSNRDQAVDAL